MARIQWELFWRILTENPHSCDEVEGRIDGEFTIFGYMKEYRNWRGWGWETVYPANPFWIGDCDVPDGVGFATAEELVNAPVFGGKSMRNVWPRMEIDGAAGMPVDIWMEQQPFPGIVYDAVQDFSSSRKVQRKIPNPLDILWIIVHNKQVKHFNTLTWQNGGHPHDRHYRLRHGQFAQRPEGIRVPGL